MKKIFLILVVTIALLGLNACKREYGKGPRVRESRTVSSFTGLQVSLPGEIHYKEGDGYTVELEGQRNILDLIETPVANNELFLKFKRQVNLRTHEQLRITVTSPGINSLVVNGSANVTTLGTFQPDDIFVHLKGSGDVNFPFLVTNELAAAITGSGDFHVGQGNVFMEELHLNGSGSMDLSEVDAMHAVLNIKGSGSMKVMVDQSLYARISGSGSIYYKGDPTVEKEISGSGRLVKQ